MQQARGPQNQARRQLPAWTEMLDLRRAQPSIGLSRADAASGVTASWAAGARQSLKHGTATLSRLCLHADVDPRCRQENAQRRAAGEDPLPEEDPQQFKPIPEPNQLDNFLITNQIATYLDQLSVYSAQSLEKLFAVEGLQRAHL